MPTPTRNHLSDLHGATRMALDAGAGITDIVERMHRTIQVLPLPLGRGPVDTTRGITGFVYRSVRGSMRLLGRGLDASRLQRWRCCRTGTRHGAGRVPVGGQWRLRRLPGADQQPARNRMSLPRHGRRVDPGDQSAAFEEERDAGPTGKLLVLVHGLCLNDRQWAREGHDHGAALADEFGHTPLYLRYNSGRHIAANGEAFAGLLETLVRHWPQPVTES